MRKFLSTAVAAATVALMGASTVGAATFTVDPGTYNPDNLTGITAEWQTVTPTDKPATKDDCKNGGYVNFTDVNGDAFRNQGQCVSYFEHASYDQVLFLEKDQLTSANAAAGATLTGVAGITLTELGFDYQGYCGAGAPRFNVYTDAGTYYFFGCTYGTHTDVGNGFTQVRFSDADAVPADGTTAWPGFGDVTVTGMEIIFDEGPASVTLDNIDVNGMIVGQQ